MARVRQWKLICHLAGVDFLRAPVNLRQWAPVLTGGQWGEHNYACWANCGTLIVGNDDPAAGAGGAGADLLTPTIN